MPSGQEVLAQAKLMLRSGDYRQARELISRSGAASPTEEAALVYIDAVASRLLGERVSRHVRAYDASDPAADDVVYYRAFMLWLDGKLNEAEALLRQHRPRSAYSSASFALLRGWIFASRSEFPQQLVVLMQALRMLVDADDGDAYLIANASLSLSALAREMPSDGALQLLERALPRISAEYASSVVHVRRAIAHIEALRGRYTMALRHLICAGEVADDPVERSFLNFDYALIAIWAKQQCVAHAAFDVARTALESVNLEERDDESALVLTVGAIAGVHIDRDVAADLANRAARIVPNISPRWGLGHGPRAMALVNEALALTTADPAAAIPLAAKASREFEAIGYRWRAGRLATHLYQISGNPSHLARAERLLEGFETGPLTLRDDPLKLPPQLRNVLNLIREGRSVDDMAIALHCTPNTVRKHIARLHARLGVKRRAELLAKVASIAS